MEVVALMPRLSWQAAAVVVVASGCSQQASPVGTPPPEGGTSDVSVGADSAVADVATGPEGGAGPPSDASIADIATPADARPSGDAAPDGDAGTIFYSTTFPLTENRISEGGRWIHLGTPWALVDTGGGVAYGTQPGDGSYTDSYAHLSGFPPNQTATATVHINAGFSPGGTREVEIHLRWADSANSARGYECNLAYNGGYAEVVRWNGPLGSYTYVSSPGRGGTGVAHHGDVRADRGQHITTWLNGRQLQPSTSSIGGTVWTDGDREWALARRSQRDARRLRVQQLQRVVASVGVAPIAPERVIASRNARILRRGCSNRRCGARRRSRGTPRALLLPQRPTIAQGSTRSS
jgi:hypothetical protein